MNPSLSFLLILLNKVRFPHEKRKRILNTRGEIYKISSKTRLFVSLKLT